VVSVWEYEQIDPKTTADCLDSFTCTSSSNPAKVSMIISHASIPLFEKERAYHTKQGDSPVELN
jgi:hypothetical protein